MKQVNGGTMIDTDNNNISDSHMIFGQNKFDFKHSEIQPTGRASKRVKYNALAYFEAYDILISGGSDRFINIYQNCYQSSSNGDTKQSSRDTSGANKSEALARYES